MLHTRDKQPMMSAVIETDEQEPEAEVCAICGRDLWSDGLQPAQDGASWICGDCDAARNCTALDP